MCVLDYAEIERKNENNSQHDFLEKQIQPERIFIVVIRKEIN